MHALIVAAHPDQASLTHSIARRLADGVAQSNDGHSFEIADLSAEGFSPQFTMTDLAVHRRDMPIPADIAFEQARIDRADALVLVFPVHWWSMPALLKGWIDRVFSNGWAYDEGPDIKSVKKLRHLNVHLIGLGGASASTYERRGYRDAMKTQIDHGIFDYCGAPVLTSELLLGSEAADVVLHLETVHSVGRHLFDVRQGEGTQAA
jgi:NAD(P)H dehydrogenase (quinone)